MKKAALIFSILISLSVQSQKRTTQFSIAAESAVMATGEAYKVYNLGFGGSCKILVPTGKKNYFTGTLGVLAFSGRSGPANEYLGLTDAYITQILASIPANLQPAMADYFNQLKNTNAAHPSLTNIPIKVGYRYFLNNKFNAELEAGYTKSFVTKYSNSISGSIGGYTFSGGFGFLVAKKLDIGLRYELFESTASETNYTSFVALRTLLMLDFK